MKMPKFALLVLLAVTLVAGQPPPRPGCNASPGIAPPECTGITKQFEGDELECQVGNYELKCDYNSEIFGANEIECQLDGTGLVRDTRFKCKIGQDCTIQCDYAQVQAATIQDVGSAGVDAIKRIFAAWIPKE